MSRKLVALSDEIKNSESLFTIEGWQSTSQGETRKEETTQGTKANPRGNMGSTSFKWKSRKTIKEQKRLARLREQKVLRALKLSRGVIVDKSQSVVKRSEEETLRNKERETSGQTTPLPVEPAKIVNFSSTQGSINSQKSVASIQKNKSSAQFLEPERTEVDLPEPESGEKRYRTFKCGGKLYRQICDDSDEVCEDEEKKQKGQRNCCRHFKLNNSKLLIFAPHRQQRSTDASLGKPYGIQLGALSVNSDYFDDDIRGKQAFDTLLVAHGVGFFKRAVNWTQKDIDEIIISGSELYKETKNVSISKLSQLTKGFTFKKHFIQVTVSEPVVVGKVMTVSERSMNLLMGLEKFFSQHKHGILQTPELDLYISYCKAFVVFDPRGRSLNGRRCRSGEAASMVLGRLSNVYHLIVNLSKIDVNSPFKISTIAITQTMKSKYSPEKFSAVSGNPMQICRTDDYVILDEHAAYLKGSIHLSSRVFQEFSPKQHLTTAIMAMAYAKIDPPNSWSSSILDRVLHFGAKLYSDVLQREPIRNIALPDIPSKFYVGDLYRVGIMIVPFFKRTSLQRTRSICDNSITKALHEIFESSFHCFLLQIGNSTYAMWQMLSSEVFYFFDGEQKDSEGNLDRYEGSSSLFMVGSIDKLCHLVVTRLMMQSYPQNATLDIHGLKIVEVTKLSSQQQKLKPNFKTVKKSCIKPLTAEAANKFEDSPSVVDSVAPLLTADKILKLREKLPEKPLFRQVSDLNSSSLVCCKTLTYEDIVNSVEKTSLIIPSGFAPETVEIILGVNSEILHKATEDEGKI